MHFSYEMFFFLGPFAFLDIRPEMVLPTVTTLLSSAISLHLFSDNSPVVVQLVVKNVGLHNSM